MAQETLQVAAVVVGSDNWTLGAGASKVAAVTTPDDSNTSYINSGATSGTIQQFTVGNTSEAIASGDTINFVRLRGFAIRGGGQNAGFIMTTVLAGNTTDGTTHSATASYAAYTSDFTTRPAGGAWTKTDVDALEIRIRNTQTRDVRCSTFEVIVDYTVATKAPPPFQRRTRFRRH